MKQSDSDCVIRPDVWFTWRLAQGKLALGRGSRCACRCASPSGCPFRPESRVLSCRPALYRRITRFNRFDRAIVAHKQRYLKLGAGWPWAGQNNTTVRPASLSFHPPFRSPVNAGALPPTGSGGTKATAKSEKSDAQSALVNRSVTLPKGGYRISLRRAWQDSAGTSSLLQPSSSYLVRQSRCFTSDRL